MFNYLPDLIFYRAHIDKMIMFPIFFIVYFTSLSLLIFILKCGFIGFFVGVALYNVYLDMLVTSISKTIHNILVSICVIWLSAKEIFHLIVDILRNKTIPSRVWEPIKCFIWLYIARMLYKKLILILLYIKGAGLLYMFLVYIAITVSFKYFYCIFMQIKGNKDKIDFSLTNSYMRQTLTLHKFILSVFLYFILRFLVYILLYCIL